MLMGRRIEASGFPHIQQNFQYRPKEEVDATVIVVKIELIIL